MAQGLANVRSDLAPFEKVKGEASADRAETAAAPFA